MQQAGMARAYGKLTVRERMQAMIQAGARNDLREAERMITAGAVGPVIRVEYAFRETVVRFTIGLSGMLARLECLAGVANVLPAMLIASSEVPLPERLLLDPIEDLQESEGLLREACSSYLQAMDKFCRQIGGVSAAEALGLYVSALAQDLEAAGVETQPVAGNEEQVAIVVEQMLKTWRVLMA